jgi:ketosteroid isomerase-like protein
MPGHGGASVSVGGHISEQTQSNQINKFFEDYVRTFDGRDGAAISMFYHVPSLTMRADKSTHCFQSRDELATFFQAVADSYAREGNEGGRFRNLVVQSIGARSALATVEWQLMRLDGTVVREWRQSYNLIRPDDRWQIFVSTIHVEG